MLPTGGQVLSAASFLFVFDIELYKVTPVCDFANTSRGLASVSIFLTLIFCFSAAFGPICAEEYSVDDGRERCL